MDNGSESKSDDVDKIGSQLHATKLDNDDCPPLPASQPVIIYFSENLMINTWRMHVPMHSVNPRGVPVICVSV